MYPYCLCLSGCRSKRRHLKPKQLDGWNARRPRIFSVATCSITTCDQGLSHRGRGQLEEDIPLRYSVKGLYAIPGRVDVSLGCLHSLIGPYSTEIAQSY